MLLGGEAHEVAVWRCRRRHLQKSSKNQGADTTSLPPQLAWQQAQTNPQDRSGAKPKIRYEGVFDLRTRYPVFWAPFPSTGGGLCDLPGRPWIELLGMSLQNQSSEGHPAPAAYLFFI